MEDTSVVDHIVLLKLADPSDTSNLCSAIKTLTGLSGVKSITCAPTFVASGGPDRTAGYNFALVVRTALSILTRTDAHPPPPRLSAAQLRCAWTRSLIWMPTLLPRPTWT